MNPVTTKVRKWGNSNAIRLPKVVTQQLDLHDGDEVIVSKDANNQITLKKKPRKAFFLEDILAIAHKDIPHNPVPLDRINETDRIVYELHK